MKFHLKIRVTIQTQLLHSLYSLKMANPGQIMQIFISLFKTLELLEVQHISFIALKGVSLCCSFYYVSLYLTVIKL